MPTPELSVPAELDGMRPGIAQHFHAISQIPRKSENEAGVRKYVADWAEGKNFVHRTDEVGNIAVDIPASPGFENKPLTILQAHMDMVCKTNKKKQVSHDFNKDPITLERTGDFLHSRGYETTLGADDAIGMTIAMDIAEHHEEFPHGPMTLLFTVQEETGLVGAAKLGPEMIPPPADKNIYLINLDSEGGPHEICNGSAAGTVVVGKMLLDNQFEQVREGYNCFQITLNGLLGGHSGLEVHKEYGNATVFLSDLLQDVVATIPETQLLKFNGGDGISNLPEEAHCQIAIPPSRKDLLDQVVERAKSRIQRDLGSGKTEELNIAVEPLASPPLALVAETRSRIMRALDRLGELDGVREYDSPGHPRISTTTGVVAQKEEDGHHSMVIMNHSRAAMSALEDLQDLKDLVRSILTENGFNIIEGGNLNKGQSVDYEGWQEPEGSLAVEAARAAHHDLFGSYPVVYACHAGAETGALKTRIEANLPGVTVFPASVGPVLPDAHRATERLEVSSVDPTRDGVQQTIVRIAA